MLQTNIAIPTEDVSEFCHRHHIQKLAFFGSVLRDDFESGSDIDVLAEFEPGHVPGLAFFGMQIELGKLLRRKVDFNTAEDLSPHFREEVLAEAETIYVTP